MTTANTDGRWPHYLWKLSPRDGPSRVIVVDPVGVVRFDPARPNERTESFLRWNAFCLRRAGGKLDVVTTMNGSDLGSFWEGLENELRHPGQLWLLSWQCGRAWSLLGLWPSLESGAIRVSGGDTRAVRDPDGIGRRANPGLLVAEDPPCLAQLRIGTQPGQILWLDCRNWGVELPAETPRGYHVAAELSDVVQRLDTIAADVTGTGLAPTAASQAFRGWRAGHLTTAVYCGVNPSVLALEKAGHVGGRCECYRMGVVPYKCYHLDFRSHYADIMVRSMLPVRLERYSPRPDVAAMDVAATSWRMMAKVTVETDEPAYPFQHEGDTIYPLGRFTTVLCGMELSDAVLRGRVIRWHKAASYEMAPALSSFASSVYEARRIADTVDDTAVSSWAKAVLNALPGKLGQRLRCWETVTDARAPEPWGEWMQPTNGGGMERWRALAGVCQRENVGGYGPDAVPAMAAWITSLGRYKLLQAIRCAGWENVAYVDTDGLLLNGDGVEKLCLAEMVCNGKLGHLEIREGPSDVEIRGIKYYLEGADVRCAGYARGVSVASEDGHGRWYTPPAVTGTREGVAVGAAATFAGWPKTPAYRHGIVQADGTVRPHQVRGD